MRCRNIGIRANIELILKKQKMETNTIKCKQLGLSLLISFRITREKHIKDHRDCSTAEPRNNKEGMVPRLREKK